jgi:hypothetical protein
VKNLEDNFASSNNLFVLEDGGSAITGFATQDTATPAGITAADIDPESYYKVIKIDKSALPEKTALLIDVSDESDKTNLFKEYVRENYIAPEDSVTKLIEDEDSGELSVEKNTLAFRHGLREVVSP